MPAATPAPAARGDLGVWRGAALYVGALIGPGLLLVPSLAADAAGPAAIIAWGAMLALSLPLAITFSALAVRHPVAGGVTAYVAEGIGRRVSAVTGTIFFAGVMLGAPAVSLIGGYYVADLTGGGSSTAIAVATAMYATVVVANTFGLRVSSGAQFALSCVLVAIVIVAAAAAVPSQEASQWQPFAPHGWWAIGTAANILFWLFFGWEAMAQFAGDFRRPDHDIPRAVALAYGTIVVLYLGLAVATVTVVSGASTVPLADLLAIGFGEAGRNVTAVLAVALTMGTMNVYLGGAAKLCEALAQTGALPAWLGAGTPRTVPRRPLIVLATTGAVIISLLAIELIFAEDLVRSTSACFVAVYVLALISATRVLTGRSKVTAAVALGMILVVMVFSAEFLLVPLVVAGLTWLAIRRRRA